MSGKQVGLIDSRLYLPKMWCDDPKHYEAAGIPVKERQFATKPTLALSLIKAAIFDWVGGDGLYGHASDFRATLDELGIAYPLGCSYQGDIDMDLRWGFSDSTC